MTISTSSVVLPRFRTESRIFAAIAAVGLAIGGAHAQSAAPGKSCDPAPAKAVSVQGTVEWKRAADAQWQPVNLNDTFCPGDSIRVQAKSRADVMMLNQSVMRLNANSTITVGAPKDQTTGVVDLVRGATNILARGPRSLEVNTPYTVAGVRGTEFYVSLEADQTLITVFEGTVLAQNATGSLSLTDGQSAAAQLGRAPALRTVVRPRDAVQWALYYPPVLYFRPDEFPAGAGWQGMVRSSSEFYAKGDLANAFKSLENAPADIRDPRFFTYRARLALAVGRVDDATADIDRALQLAPNDANALSLQAIMAIVQNDKDRALAIAEKNVAANPTSASARIALSYAQQARFDLPGARASVEKAVELDPQNALAFARLAELSSSFGDYDATFAAAQKAVALDPNLARTQTVLGFAYLVQVKTAEARAAFDKAIVLDQADPLPRLGLGLAKIRDGRLDEGGRDIEIAASLDPTNALVRSYLGKVYYEEKLFPRDEREFKVAKELDPKDPTPFFYDAILKQTTNRPVEALQEMEKAIALNDNRAVYRSELLLDSDNASRSASLARIYTDLGFQQLALVEGYKSVNADPTNFSAHRFLADTYSVLPRHEIARVSELLQSQLLQPINLTPLQPRMAESNLFLISSGGPGTASFSEFNPLFTSDGYTVQRNGMGGQNNTWGGDAVVAGIVRQGCVQRRLLGVQDRRVPRQQRPERPDLRRVRPVRLHAADERAGGIPASRTSRPATCRCASSTTPFAPGERNKTETDIGPPRVPARVLARRRSCWRRSSTRTLVIRVTDDQNLPPVTMLDFSAPEKSLSSELQYLFRSPQFNVTTGIGYFDVNGRPRHDDRASTFRLPTARDRSTSRSTQSTDVRHLNLYAYGYWKPFDEPERHARRQRRLPQWRQPRGGRQEPGRTRSSASSGTRCPARRCGRRRSGC